MRSPAHTQRRRRAARARMIVMDALGALILFALLVAVLVVTPD